MKKSLIALAALAAVGAASAQSSVTLYGVVDIGYGSQTSEMRATATGTNKFNTRGVMDGANAGNRIGYSGIDIFVANQGSSRFLSFISSSDTNVGTEFFFVMVFTETTEDNT